MLDTRDTSEVWNPRGGGVGPESGRHQGHLAGGESQTDLYGGIHCVWGTHMRSPRWTYAFLKHPQLRERLKDPESSATLINVYALSNLAMLTCGKTTWRRICRQVCCCCSRTPPL